MDVNKKRYKLKKKLNHSYNRGNRTAQSKRYRENYPEKVSAQQAVHRAIKKGILIRPKICPKCGTGDFIQGHHKNYGKWLEVMWLCWKCHNLIPNQKKAR